MWSYVIRFDVITVPGGEIVTVNDWKIDGWSDDNACERACKDANRSMPGHLRCVSPRIMRREWLGCPC